VKKTVKNTTRHLVYRRLQELRQSRRCAPHCHLVKDFAIVTVKDAECRLAQAHRFFEHRVKDRGEVTGRGIDHAQNFSGRGLLLQSLVALDKRFKETPPQIRVGPLQIGYRVIYRRGQLLIPSGRASSHLVTICGMGPPRPSLAR